MNFCCMRNNRISHGFLSIIHVSLIQDLGGLRLLGLNAQLWLCLTYFWQRDPLMNVGIRLKVNDLPKLFYTYELSLRCGKRLLNVFKWNILRVASSALQEIESHVKIALKLNQTAILARDHQRPLSFQ